MLLKVLFNRIPHIDFCDIFQNFDRSHFLHLAAVFFFWEGDRSEKQQGFMEVRIRTRVDVFKSYRERYSVQEDGHKCRTVESKLKTLFVFSKMKTFNIFQLVYVNKLNESSVN